MSNERFFKNFILGVTDGEINVDDRAANIAAIHQLTQSAVLNLNIISRYLDHNIFDRSDVIDVMSSFTRKNRLSSLRILVYDSASIVKNGHRLALLASKIPSKISIRSLPRSFNDFNQSFALADSRGYLFNPQSDRYEGTVSFNDTARCIELSKTFTHLWDQSREDPNLVNRVL